MSDRWTDRLSEYLDGELSAAESRELEAHLEGCGECREILADLRRVIDRAASLRDRAPGTELWAGIEQRIRPAPPAPPEIRVVSLFDAKRARRRISLSVPQLLAAGLVLALASAGSMWVALRDGGAGAAGPVALAPVEVMREAPAQAPTALPHEEAAEAVAPEVRDALPAAGSGRTEPAVRSVREAAPGPSRPLPRTERSSRFAGLSADPAYDAAVSDLQAILDQGRDRLDPRTVQVLEESLKTIDAAIDDARQALEADPANARLNTYLAGTRQRKLELLREASQIVTATT